MARPRLARWRKWTDEKGNLYEIVVWKVTRSVRYREGVRYRLAFIRQREETPAVLYDNHYPKGHHRHVGAREEPYNFVTVRQLIAEFLADSAALVGGER